MHFRDPVSDILTMMWSDGVNGSAIVEFRVIFGDFFKRNY